MSILRRSPIKISWIHARDFDGCGAVDLSSTQPLVEPWSRYQWRLYLRGEETRCLTACHGRDVVGYLGYSCVEHTVSIDRMAVTQDKRRQGIGATLLRCMCNLAVRSTTTNVVTLLPEHWLSGQCFLRQHGFTCTQTLYGFCEQMRRDAYVFERHVGSQIKEAAKCRGR